MYRKLYKTGIVAYLLLVIIAALFYKERTIFIDAAYHLFYIIKDNSFAIQHGRYGAAVTQIFPLVFRKVQASPDSTMFIYSIGFILYYFICYFLCGQVLKQYALALCLLLFNILFVSDTFYWIPSELPQGICCMFVMFAVFKTERIPNKYIQYTIGGALVIFTAFFHPLLLFPFLFVMGYQFIGKKIFTVGNKQLLAIILFYGIVLALKTLFFATPYDHSAFGSVKNMATLFPNYIDIPTNKYFLTSMLGKYYWIPVVTTGIVALYAVKKQWLKASLFLAFFAGYLLLINVSYAHVPFRELFYVENLYLPLGIILAVPLVFELLPHLYNKNKLLPLVLLLAIITTGVIRIYSAHTPYTNRLNWEREFLASHKNEKLLIDESKVPLDTLLMTWGTAFEFWLLSTVEEGSSASIIITDNMETRIWAKDKADCFIDQWNVTPYSELPDNYFRFMDTTSTYKVVK